MSSSSIMQRNQQLRSSGATQQEQPKLTSVTTSAVPSKKKFGKNLNKLVKPAAPPIQPTEKLRSSRNGLLLLKSGSRNSNTSSGGLLSSSGNASGGGGGLLSSKPTTSSSTSLSAGVPTTISTTRKTKPSPAASASQPSTHDALLSAVVGASAGDAGEASAQPDAWGCKAAAAEKLHQIEEKEASVENNSSSKYDEEDATNPSTALAGKNDRKDDSSAAARSMKNDEYTQSSTTMTNDRLSRPSHGVQVDWNEYGGRERRRRPDAALVDFDNQHAAQPERTHHSNSVNKGDCRPIDTVEAQQQDQVAYMSKLAKDKAEKKRLEEDAVRLVQKERANQRLAELDQKKSEAANANKQQLPRWDRPRNANGSREIWEPAKSAEESPIRRSNKNGLSSSLDTTSITGTAQSTTTSAADQDGNPGQQHYNGAVIQLTSYEARDRGEGGRTAAAKPRMLYDPKSGKMVELKSKQEEAPKRKERNKKNRKDKENKSESVADASNNKNGRKNKSKKEHNGESKADNRTSASETAAKRQRSLPRTCGVLYKRDSNGVAVSTDGCEGDLGYGAHSVPGGRNKNKSAYAAWTEQQKQQQQGGDFSSFIKNMKDNPYSSPRDHDDQGKSANNSLLPLHTGFALDEAAPVTMEWLKANDKIELVTGVDSPTLKPTAKEFAPSGAAIAAALAAKRPEATSDNEQTDGVANSVAVAAMDDDDEREEDGMGHGASLGLGFDPTMDMDIVIQSPSAKAESSEVDVDQLVSSVNLNTLQLEPSVFAASGNSNPKPTSATGPRHIFAFGSSGTWGATQPSTLGQGNADWSSVIPTNTNNAASADASAGANSGTGLSLFGVSESSSLGDEDKDATPAVAASFLNISPSTSWGSPLLGGVRDMKPVTRSAPCD